MKKKIMMPLILQVSKLFFDKQKIVWHEIRNEGVYTDENQKNWKMVAVIGDLGVHKRFFPHKL